MDWRDIAAAVGREAPLLGTLLGGPAGTAASIGGLIASAIGSGATPAAVAAAIQDPDAITKLRAAELAHQDRAAELAHQMALASIQASADDRASARQREISVRDWTPRILAGLVVLGAGSAEAYVLLSGSPTGVDGTIIGRILGTLDSALLLVLSYYFGSSAGSARKDELIAASR